MSLRSASLNARWSAIAGSTYQRISFRVTFFVNRPTLPRSPGRCSSGRSAVTGHSRSASARAESRICGAPCTAAVSTAPLRTSSWSRA